MNRIAKIGFLAFSLSFVALAQTATPNTTLCAAQTATQTSVCLTSTTGVVNQTGVFVDEEYELVQLSANISVCTGPCNVPVSRANRGAKTGPLAHLNSSIAWLALTPGSSLQPGANGFSQSTTMNSIGPCTRTSQIYLPVIYQNLGIKRDCNVGGTLASGQAGVWVDYAPGAGLDYPSPTPIITLAANGALAVASGHYELITKAGVIALTLAAPTAGIDDGKVIVIHANNGAFADTLVATGLLQTGGGSSPYTTATFGVTAAFNGATLKIMALGGFWFVVSSTGVAFT